MKFAAILIVRLYRELWPRHLRRTCIFADSCSSYVLAGLQTDGVRMGFVRFTERWRKCRAGYVQISAPAVAENLVLLADGTVVNPNQLSDAVRRELNID